MNMNNMNCNFNDGLEKAREIIAEYQRNRPKFVCCVGPTGPTGPSGGPTGPTGEIGPTGPTDTLVSESK